jgi:hypothetical protein
MPTGVAMHAVTIARNRVLPSRSPTSSAIGRPLASDVPKSPCSVCDSHIR